MWRRILAPQPPFKVKTRFLEMFMTLHLRILFAGSLILASRDWSSEALSRRPALSRRRCTSPSPKREPFNFDGLWTDYNDGTWPSCCRGPRFDMKELHESLAPRAADPNNDWHDYKLNHARCKVSQIQFLQALLDQASLVKSGGFTICSNEAGFRNQMLDAIKGVSKSNKYVLFINSCFAHSQFERQDTWFANDSPMIEDKVLRFFSLDRDLRIGGV
ncbi:hypothetical protein Syun_012375 [Stephania yunnanensis]|uniref:Pectin acetylesterase n=1 Tax=Stephania yunnanensis TaxID=152371 RepID=A0AAP0PIY0_9MAGN